MKPKRKNDGSPTLFTGKVLLKMLLAALLSLGICAIIFLIVASLVMQQVRSNMESVATGDAAREYIENILHAPLPVSATDIEYRAFGLLDTYDADFHFSLPPQDYEAYAAQAQPRCVVPALKDGDQELQPDCHSLTSMTITIDRSDSALWRIRIAVRGSA